MSKRTHESDDDVSEDVRAEKHARSSSALTDELPFGGSARVAANATALRARELPFHGGMNEDDFENFCAELLFTTYGCWEEMPIRFASFTLVSD